MKGDLNAAMTQPSRRKPSSTGNSPLVSRIGKDLEDCRRNLSYTNSSAVKKIGEANPTLHLYSDLKANCRLLLTQLTCVNGSNDAKRSVHSNELQDFEDENNLVLLTQGQQLKAILTLYHLCDRTVFQLCHTLNAKAASFSFLSSTSSILNQKISNPEGTAGVSEFLRLLESFRTMEKLIRFLADKRDVNTASVVSDTHLRKELLALKNELNSRNTVITALESRLTEINDSADRQQTVSRLQLLVLNYEEKNKQLEQSLVSSQSENRNLSQMNTDLKESLRITESQLESARETYRKDFSKFKPVLEKQIKQLRSYESEVKSVKLNIEHGKARFSAEEMRGKESQNELQEFRRLLTAALEEKSDLQKEIKHLNSRIEKNHMVTLVVVAAKMKYETIATEVGAKVKELDRLRLEENIMSDKYLKELNECRSELIVRAEIIERNKEEILFLEENLCSLSEKNKKQHDLYTEMKYELDDIMERGMTVEKQKEFDLLSFGFKSTNKSINVLQQSLLAAQGKIDDLQMQALR